MDDRSPARTTETRAIETLAFVAAPHERSGEARRRLIARYGDTPPENADAIVALGGDGFMLRTLHRFMDKGVPIYGMNRGSVGFLMNAFSEDNLLGRLNRAEVTALHPLQVSARTVDGDTRRAPALNELSLLRQTHAAAKLRVSVDGKIRLDELISDGILLATPAGSTAYNLSAHGPIVPIDAPLMALTPISPFRPRRWRGALLPNSAQVVIDVIDAPARSVGAAADFHDLGSVVQVRAETRTASVALLMFDTDHNLRERILNEQFLY